MPDLSTGRTSNATTPPPYSAADKAAHAAASHVRLPVRTPGAIKVAVETENAYAERDRQLRTAVLAERAQAGVL